MDGSPGIRAHELTSTRNHRPDINPNPQIFDSDEANASPTHTMITPMNSTTPTGVHTDPHAGSPRTQPLKPWKVIVHDDDVNTYAHVIKSFIEVVRMKGEDAFRHTVEVDTKGLSIVAITHRERAELLLELLQARALTVSIEPE